MTRTSDITGFYKLSPEERIKVVKEFANLTNEEIESIHSMRGLTLEQANKMIENVIGAIQIPIGVAVNFIINGRDYLIPMAIEEPSVVAAASNAARIARIKGGFFTSSIGSMMIGQIQSVGVKDPNSAKIDLFAAKSKILAKANEQDPVLLSLGGGAKDFDVKIISTLTGPMVITELYVDCKDAMGANVVNTMAEAISPLIEKIIGGKVILRIISNLATKRLARARVVIDNKTVGGDEIVDGIVHAYAFAASDPYRAATHNKGIMNGIIAVALATGNDTRALEAGAHSYAARNGHYDSLTTWERNEDGDLVGTIELPMAVGTIGGATAVHPVAKTCTKILRVKSATELAEIMVAVGLAQNLAAMRALVAEGIQRGHMRLHAKNVAMMAGATDALVDRIAEKMVEEGNVKINRAKELLEELSSK